MQTAAFTHACWDDASAAGDDERAGRLFEESSIRRAPSCLLPSCLLAGTGARAAAGAVLLLVLLPAHIAVMGV